MQQAHSKLLAAQMLPIRKLKIAYCLPHHNVTGGLKMMLQQVGEASVLFDFNHPLAGQPVSFEVQLIGVL